MNISESRSFTKPIKIMDTVEGEDISSSLTKIDLRIFFSEGKAMIDLYEWCLEIDFSGNLSTRILTKLPSSFESKLKLFEGEINDLELLKIHQDVYLIVDESNLVLLLKNGTVYSILKIIDLDGDGYKSSWNHSKLDTYMNIA